MSIAKIHSMVDLSRSDVVRLINEYCFCCRQREILKSRWIDGLTFKEIAEKHEISERQAINIIRENREKVLLHIGEIKLQ